MNPSRIIRKLFSTPPQRLARTAFILARREWQVKSAYQRDQAKPTYATSLPPIGELYSYFPALPFETLRPHTDWIAGLTANYVANRFDLLGSGWVQVRYGMECRGLEEFVYPPPDFTTDTAGEWLTGHISANNLSESRRLWKLLDADYKPIDWQRDFISGHRWESKTWYKNIAYGKIPGADIKVPWELARMQHLPQLAWAYALAREEEPNFLSPETYVRTFRNQVLDFIATNPPRFGVNWVCTMDVAIRVANWLAGFDLLTKYGAIFDAEFVRIFRRSIYEHAAHIVSNLEWNENLRGNHYLADIVGLLFCAAYLPIDKTSTAWLALALQEFANEIWLQFNMDGSNFEASTAYHRLSGEMALYGVALTLALPQEKRTCLESYDHTLVHGKPALLPAPLKMYPLPDSELKSPFPTQTLYRLAYLAHATVIFSKPNGNIVQFGDNDSGRFLILQPAAFLRQGVWHTSDLNCRHLIAGIDALFRNELFQAVSSSYWFERDLLRDLVHKMHFQYESETSSPQGSTTSTSDDWKDAEWLKALREWDDAPDAQKRLYEWHFENKNLNERLPFYRYKGFGLYIWRKANFFLAVRCGAIGQRGNGGHAHNDQLAIELVVDGKNIVLDPGTYVYTPLPNRRNQYRSVRAHFAPYVEGREPGDMTLGLFQLGDEAKAKVLYVTKTQFVGRHWGYGSPVTRIIEIEANTIRVKDYSESLPLAEPQPDKLPYSPGYGKRII